MFSNGTSTLTQRALAAAEAFRSFLLLEDDVRVDWEVDQARETGNADAQRAPLHARALTRPPRKRRPGEAPATAHVCLSPVDEAPARHELVSRSNARALARDGRPPGRRPSSR